MQRRFGEVFLGSRASLENPNTPLDDDEGWLGAPSTSGVRVSRESALKYSPVWRAVNLISRDVAKLPLMVMKRIGEGKERANEHSVYRLLRYKPNAEMTAFVFKQTLMANAMLDGNGYAFVDRAGNARTLELIPLLSGTCVPVRADGELLYVVQVGASTRKLLPENVIHIKGLSVDGLCGYRVINKAKDSIGGGIAAAQFGRKYFSNDAAPNLVLEHPGELTDKALKRLRESWNAIHQGLDNAHKTAILEQGMKVTAFGGNARQAQLLEMRTFELREVANWFFIPPHKLGDTSKVSYTSLESENQAYLDDALDPWLVNIEEEFREKLLTETQKRDDTHVIEFNRAALLRADMAARGEFYVKATGGHPWMTVNEVRGRENMNPMKGFDEIKSPTNNFAGGGVTEEDSNRDPDADALPADPPPAPVKKKRAKKGDATAIEAIDLVLLDAVRRMCTRLATHARKAVKAADLGDWISSGITQHRDVVVDALRPGVAARSAVAGRSITAECLADKLIDSVRAELASGGADIDARIKSLEEELPGSFLPTALRDKRGK